jgi:DNA transposition AAA+ family ATPase
MANIATTKNIIAFQQVYGDLQNRRDWVHGIGLVTGAPGTGKTTACTLLKNQKNCIFVEALLYWTPKSMLQALLRELGADTRGAIADLHYRLVERLRESGRAVLIDETNSLLDSRHCRPMLEGIRKLSDQSGVPWMLVGYGDFKGQLEHRYPQLAGRISREAIFSPLDLEDTLDVLRTLTRLEISPDLAQQVFAWARGSIRKTGTAANAILDQAQLYDWRRVDAASWGDRGFQGEVA